LTKINTPNKKPRWQSNYRSVWESPNKIETKEISITREAFLVGNESAGTSGWEKDGTIPADWIWKNASEFPAYDTTSGSLEEGQLDPIIGVIVLDGQRIKLRDQRITGDPNQITIQGSIIVGTKTYTISNGFVTEVVA